MGDFFSVHSVHYRRSRLTDRICNGPDEFSELRDCSRFLGTYCTPESVVSESPGHERQGVPCRLEHNFFF